MNKLCGMHSVHWLERNELQPENNCSSGASAGNTVLSPERQNGSIQIERVETSQRLFHRKQVKISLSSALQEEVVQIAGWKQFLKQKQPLQHGRDWPVSSWEACLLFGTILGLGDEVESQMQQCCTAEQREQFSRLPVDHTLFLIRDCCYQMLANCRRAKELVEQRSTD